MAIRNPYDKYNNTVFSAPQEELTLMLYNGALKFCNQSIIALENNDLEKAGNMLLKTQRIIRELQITLNYKYEISNQLGAMYEYIHTKLVDSNIKKDMNTLLEVRDLIRNLRDTWKEAIVIARKEG